MQTIGEKLDENRGIGKGFDTLRVVLAFAVIAWHCVPLTQGNGDAAKASGAWPLIYSIVPMFFALSGFLITGSALRLKLGKFAASRILRIVPALAVDTIFTVIVIGPILTSASMEEYFSDKITYSYLLNIIGEIHNELPGLFLNNPYASIVNGSLWTIPPELGCYLIIAILILFGWVKDWRLVLGVLVSAFLAIVLLRGPFSGFDAPGINFVRSNPGAKLIPMFLSGAILYLLRYKIPYSLGIFTISVIAVLITGIFDSTRWWESMGYVIPTSILYTYIVVFIGMTSLPKIPLFSKGDYSYGVYLYGFPIQQAIVQLTDVRDPGILFLITVVPVTLLAMFSWHLVEKPALKLRKGFSLAAKIEAERVDEGAVADVRKPIEAG